MKAISGKQLCRLLEDNGWGLRRTSGSHRIYAKMPLKLGLQKHLMKLAEINHYGLKSIVWVAIESRYFG